ncbi:MAG: DUF512 domain-containing protein [Desulfocucumaceae bacterium]
MKKKGLTVGNVAGRSIAEEVGVEAGDTLLSVNSQPVTDLLDYLFYSREQLLIIELQKNNGDLWELEIEKEPELDLGIEFEATGLEKIKSCANRCIFCFVDQMPPGLRDTLYVKDDDYRLSFLQGSFITLTNLSDRDFHRISRLRLSPLYVSVHTTDPGLRKEIMGSPRAGEIMERLKYLAGRGIDLHTQAVICPDINDGGQLDRTVSDLSGLWPGVKSLAVVPAGLTAMRKHLHPIRQFSPGEASEIVGKIRGWQDKFLKYFKYPFVFASDEFYFLAGMDIPTRARYADFPQTENGVGLARLFLDEWSRAKRRLPGEIKKTLSVSLVTGMLGPRLLDPVTEGLNMVKNLKASVVAIENRFFGRTVTTAGLLTGKDILGSRDRMKGSDIVIIPESVTRRDSRLTLDQMTVEDLKAGIGAEVTTASGPTELIRIIKNAAGV